MLVPVIIVGALIFIPLLVIAMAVLRSPTRAFVLSATFAMGGMVGFFLGLLGGGPLLGRHSSQTPELIYLFTFAALAAIAGGLIAVWLLGKLAGRSLWQRHS